MEEIIRTLDLHRTSFSKIFDTTNQLTKDNPDMNQVRSNIQVLAQKMQNISHQLDQRYLDLLFDQNPEDIDLDSEMAKIDEYMCKFSALKMKVETEVSLSVDVIHKKTSSTSSCCTQSCTKLQLKYPQIEFRKFGGDIRDWLSFWSQRL